MPTALPTMLLSSEFFRDVRQVVVFMKKTGIRMRFFSVSLFFSLGLTLFNLYTVALLFPLVQGIIESDFSHVRDLPAVGTIVRLICSAPPSGSFCCWPAGSI
jgi:hypothetical protein